MRIFVQATHECSCNAEKLQVVPQKATIPFPKPGAR
jgi:hypothetical protein